MVKTRDRVASIARTENAGVARFRLVRYPQPNPTRLWERPRTGWRWEAHDDFLGPWGYPRKKDREQTRCADEKVKKETYARSGCFVFP